MEKKSYKKVLFVESGPTDSFSKLPYMLRKKGYHTTLLTLVGDSPEGFIKKSYDKMISFNFKFFKINLKNLPAILLYSAKKFLFVLKAFIQALFLHPDIVISRATPSWLCYLAKKYYYNSLFIYFPYDIRSFSYTDLREALKDGTPKFEIKAERYCFENSDGILHKGFEDELQNLNEKVLGENIKVKCPNILFFPYCLPELVVQLPNIKKNKKNEIHIVYVGHIATNKDWMDNFAKIINQKIHLHLYGRTANLSKEEEKIHLQSIEPSLLKSPYFHLHPAVDQEKLPQEISKYDYGFFSFNNKKSYFVATAIGNKIASYLEAGIPILCFKNYVLIDQLISKYKIGISIENNKLKNLRKILSKNKPEKFMKSIPKARREFSIENRLLELERFFDVVARYKNSR